jgi:signal transduction histidine kinase
VDTLLALAREAEGGRKPGRDAGTAPAEPVALLALLEEWVLAHADWLDRQALRLDIQLDHHARLALPAPVLRLALASLLGNAFAHGRAGGAVAVRFDDGALCITNPGDGSEEADDGQAPRSGHGFGLAIVQRLLGAAGGRLDFGQRDGLTWARVCA